MYQSALWARFSRYCCTPVSVAALALMMVGHAHAADITAGEVCRPAVSGVEVSAINQCLVSGHLTAVMGSGPPDSFGSPINVLVESATPDTLVFSYDLNVNVGIAGGGYAAGDSIWFGRQAAVYVEEGYQIESMSITAYGTAVVRGDGNASYYTGYGPVYYVRGEPGVNKTVTFEMNRTLSPRPGPINPDDSFWVVSRDLYGPLFGFSYSAAAGDSISINVDRVVYSASVVAVPEPSTWALMGLGLIGLTLVRRRQQA